MQPRRWVWEKKSFLADWKSDGNRQSRRTWSENRKLKMAHRKDRRHFDDVDGRPDRQKGRRRLSIAELKKVTKCANCGEKGHWAEDCKKPFKPKQNSGNSGNAFVFLGHGRDSSGFVGSSFFMSLAEGGNFLCLPGGHAIVDPGASQDLIGWIVTFDFNSV